MLAIKNIYRLPVFTYNKQKKSRVMLKCVFKEYEKIAPVLCKQYFVACKNIQISKNSYL